MANESCGPTPAASEPVKPGTRMVHCVKFGRDMPGLDRPPWKGELGKRVFESVSKDAWKLWIEHSAKAPSSPKATWPPKPKANLDCGGLACLPQAGRRYCGHCLMAARTAAKKVKSPGNLSKVSS